VLLAYVAVLFVADVDWLAAAEGLVMPSFPLNGDSFTVIVAILGTTMSPYLLFGKAPRNSRKLNKTRKPRWSGHRMGRNVKSGASDWIRSSASLFPMWSRLPS
jgi:Mn2+/Fe2+ NRAMP family transporter